ITASRALVFVAVLIMFSGIASADTLAIFGPTSLTNVAPTQFGRLVRNGIPQNWAGSESFPGSTSPTTLYHYRTFAVNVGLTPFVQVIMDDVSTTEFASAYLGSYNPTSLATNWLGDAGSSGNAFGVDPRVFQVHVPIDSTIVIVINNTTGGALTDT